VRGEPLFDAQPGCPTSTPIVAAGGTQRVPAPDIADRNAPGGVEQPVPLRPRGVPDTTAKCTEGVEIGSAGMRRGTADVGPPAEIGPGKIAFDSVNPRPSLPIVPQGAADEASADPEVAVFINQIRYRERDRPRISLIGMTDAIAADEAAIGAGPTRGRRGQGLDRQIRSRNGGNRRREKRCSGKCPLC
jgi:hypothetical protein